jgi:hypothetical protein
MSPKNDFRSPEPNDDFNEDQNDLNEEINDDEDLRESRVGRSGQWGDPTEPPLVEVSFEELLELQEELDDDDDTLGELYNTANTDGSTENVYQAMEQGLVYTPPTDPPVVPSDDLQGIEMAAGFASSIEDDYESRKLPGATGGEDSDVESELRRALRFNSETMHLDDIRIHVREGIAYLRGTVDDEEDIALVEDFIRDLDVVDDIENELETDDNS